MEGCGPEIEGHSERAADQTHGTATEQVYRQASPASSKVHDCAMQMERNMVSQAHEALQAAHEALRAEAQCASEVSAEQRREAAARDKATDATEAAAVAQLHARMGELQVCLCFAGFSCKSGSVRRKICRWSVLVM